MHLTTRQKIQDFVQEGVLGTKLAQGGANLRIYERKQYFLFE